MIDSNLSDSALIGARGQRRRGARCGYSWKLRKPPCHLSCQHVNDNLHLQLGSSFFAARGCFLGGGGTRKSGRAIVSGGTSSLDDDLAELG